MRALAGIVVALLVAGCAPPDDGAPSVRPGDLLVDAAREARVVTYPQTNLSPRVARLVDDAVASAGDPESAVVSLVTPILDGWRIDRRARDEGLAPPGMKVFELTPELPRLDAPPTVLRDGRPEVTWDGRGPMPDSFVSWNASRGVLQAVAPDRPDDVRLGFDARVADEFGAWDVSRGLLFETPRVEELARRVELGDVSRPAWLAPPPTRLAFDLDRLDASALDVSVGAVDRAWTTVSLADGDAIARDPAPERSAIQFGVDVVGDDGLRVPVWRTLLEAEDVGERWLDVRVDLSRWQGQPITVELVTEVPVGASLDHAFAAWSGLRLRGDAARTPPRPHVVLVDIDTLRADRLGMYGHDRDTSPRLDAWAAERAVVFESARSTGPYTLPATASMLTGLDVHQHEVDTRGDALAPNAGSIAAVLSAVGYETYGAAEGGFVSSVFGFDHGFDTYATLPTTQRGWDTAVNWVQRRDSETPLFLFLHTYLVHAPFDPDPRFVDPAYAGTYAGETITNELIDELARGDVAFDPGDRRYVSDLYDGVVHRMDALVADVLTQLDDALDGEVLWILTSDHGEELFERDLLGHGHSLYNELLRVPLVVAFPDGRTGRDDRPASLVDLVPTILDVVGVDVPPHLPGHSLAGPAPAGRARVGRFAGETRSIELDGWKLIVGPAISSPAGPPPSPQLFELSTDPGERSDRSARDADRLAELDEALATYLDTWRAHVPVASSNAGAATRQRLIDLGYAEDDGARDDR